MGSALSLRADFDGARQSKAAMAQAIERGPTPYLDGVVRRRLADRTQGLWEEFRVSVREQTLSREVRAMG
ncbi:hypothetical protein LXM94_25410 [Rhizobium sp. TRM95111]|uniref:hypothetical protein n=1 Tax=Rhizobium alarense TaxID=2846851 RepID=UPI001F34EFA9|nr:hypothetical protein [Rhizobium alarense]MCF3643295.1 hypothetical protein [Rhizobium alarense]